MKKLIILCAFIASMLCGKAQTVTDNFTVGPYEVDYYGQGDFKYRLRDNINLYNYFELKRDTTIVTNVVETPVRHALQISGYVGANRYAAKEIGISGVWKQNICTNLFFNGGVSIAIDHSDLSRYSKREMLEAGIPLQVEVGKLKHNAASLYGAFGITPTLYSTMSVKRWDGKENEFVDDKDLKKAGFLIAPSLEFGGNIPVGNSIVRIGVYGTYKINCTTGDVDVYKLSAGRCFLGAKIGFVL